MAGKKGQVVQLQLKVNTEEEWKNLLEKDGLVGKHCNKCTDSGNTVAGSHGYVLQCSTQLC
jgi:hypothetical protein